MKHCTAIVLLALSIHTFAQKKDIARLTVSVSGYVESAKSGERIIGCVVYDSITRNAVTTNAFGYFNLTVNGGTYILAFHSMGYRDQSIRFTTRSDTVINVRLAETSIELNEVVISANPKSEAMLSKPQMGQISINSKMVKRLPVLLGEPDVMRAIQTLPGIQAANERSTGISVRGGGIDQNLFLMDDAPVFQISHIMGFYSVFNNDAIKDVKVYKGDIPANYGGRLSSLIDIRLKDGNMQNFAVTGGIGLVTSDLSIEGPVKKDKASFIISGKYSYIGLLYHKINPNINTSFYDLNCKFNLIINSKNRIYVSSYTGGDDFLSYNYQNNTLSLRWNHIYTPSLFSNISLIYSNYRFISASSYSNFNYTWRSGIKQITLKAEYNYFINNRNTIDFGFSSTYNDFIPGRLAGNRESINQIQKSTPFSNRVINRQGVLEHAVYVSNQQKITGKLSVRYGVRGSLYQNMGGHWVYKLTGYLATDSFYARKNHVYCSYISLEPRVSINYRLGRNSAIKASYTYATQQTQLLTRTNGGGPLDIWFPSDNNIKPQKSSQYSGGYVCYLFNRHLEANIEGYYKTMNNLIDLKDGATFLSKSSTLYINKTTYNFEEQLRTGNGYSYGAELSLAYDFKRINGYLNYTYARSRRKIAGINSGATYLSPFDKPHTFDAVLSINLTRRVSVSANFRWQSGQVTTIPVYIATMFGKTIKGYSNRNEYRLPDYIRPDLSLTIKNKEKVNKSYHSEWNFSVINVTNHANIAYVNFVSSEENPDIIEAKGVYILGFLPSISYRFNF